MRKQLLIVAAALACGIAFWVGGYALRYGGLRAGVVRIVLEQPAFAAWLGRLSGNDPATTLPDGITAARVGDAARELTLPDLDGTWRDLAEWNGQPIVLAFWATWCAPCLEEMPWFDRLARERADLAVIGIGLDDENAIRAVLDAQPVGFPQLVGEAAGYDVSVAFGNTLGAVPYTVLIGKDGKIRRQRLAQFASFEDMEAWASD